MGWEGLLGCEWRPSRWMTGDTIRTLQIIIAQHREKQRKVRVGDWLAGWMDCGNVQKYSSSSESYYDCLPYEEGAGAKKFIFGGDGGGD